MTWQTDQDILARDGRMYALRTRVENAGISKQFFDKKMTDLARNRVPLVIAFNKLEDFVEDLEVGRTIMTVKPLSPPIQKLYPLSQGTEPRRRDNAKLK